MALKTAVGSYGHTAALKDGSVNPAGSEWEHVEVSPIINAFRRMVRQLEFDVCEMAISTYLCARAFDKPITAIPVFLVRAFHHGAVAYNTKSGIKGPGDLAGRRVGVRGYTTTTGLWARGILQTEYGVDLNKVTWVLSGDEHVAEYQAPSNVVNAPEGKELEQMLLDGEIDAAIGVRNSDSPDIKPLVADAASLSAQWFQRSGVYPINHTLVVKDELLAAQPDLGANIFAAFKEARDRYLTKLSAGGEVSPRDENILRMQKVVGDPLPYGVKKNRPALEMVLQFNKDQKLTPRKFDIEEVFANGTLDLD